MIHTSENTNNRPGVSYNRRSAGVDTSPVLRFIATSFVYLLAGLVFFLFNTIGVLNLERDAIFVLWLFGFVSMIIFGLSYMFSSGLSRNGALMNRTVTKEFYLLNAGIIIFFVGFSTALPIYLGKPLVLTGLILIIISVSLHLMNLVLVVGTKNSANERKQTFEDKY